MMFVVIGVLLIHCCWSHAETGVCNTWEAPPGINDFVCCKRCIEGYRIVQECGPSQDDLCVPCENDTFTLDPSKKECTKCRQCGGVHHTVEACTRTKDTQCGCRDPRFPLCSDKHCSICIKQCGSGQEPQGGYCRPSPATITTTMATTTQRHIESNEEDTMLPWWLVITVSCVVLLIPLILMLRVFTKLKAKKGQVMAKKPPFITTPTDEPRTLMAIECSFHEPEQVSSSESLAFEASEDSTRKLIV